MQALDGGLNALAMQLCGDMPGPCTADRSNPTPAAGRSTLANVTKQSADAPNSVDTAAANNGSAPAAAVQAGSQGPADALPLKDADEARPTSAAAGLPIAAQGTHHHSLSCTLVYGLYISRLAAAAGASHNHRLLRVCHADGKYDEQADETTGQPASGEGGSSRAAGKRQHTDRPSRNKRRRPLRLCATPSPAQPSKRASRRAQHDAAPELKNEAPPGDTVKQAKEPQPKTEAEPGIEASPELRGTLLDLEQRLSTGIPNDDAREQASEAARPAKRARRGTAAPAKRQGVQPRLQCDVSVLRHVRCIGMQAFLPRQQLNRYVSLQGNQWSKQAGSALPAG